MVIESKIMNYDPEGPEDDFRQMLAEMIKDSFIVIEDNPLFIIPVKDVRQNKQHPFRNRGKPDIIINISEPASMFHSYTHLPQHDLTNPFFIETKPYGKTKEGVNQGNVYKYIEDGDLEKTKHRTDRNGNVKIDRKFGDFRMIVTDPEIFEFYKQEGSNIQARDMEHHHLWKVGLGCLYRLQHASRILHVTFNEQDVIDFIPNEYLKMYPETVMKIRNMTTIDDDVVKKANYTRNSHVIGNANYIFEKVAKELENKSE